MAERRRRNYGKELPPITLSNTNISGLVTLIPILVSLTNQGQSPRFDDEKDKPVWWPSDIRWQNPKSYSTYMGDNILKILRKVVRSCYSYHGVEDLLCCLDETPLAYNVEDEDNLECVDLTDTNFIGDEGPDSCSSSDNLVFVCCFCLEEFSSHEEVTCHQNMCHLRFQVQNMEGDTKTSNEKDSRLSPVKAQLNSSSKPASPPYPVSLHKSNGLAASSRIPDVPSQVGSSRKAFNELSTSAEKSSSCPKQKSSASSTKSGNHQVSMSSAAKKQSSFFPFVPTLKTRSQKKLEQIMEKHNSRKLMLSECKQMKSVADKGAWWIQKPRRRKSCAHTPHPSSFQAKESFLASCGLTLRVNADTQAKDLKPAVDLDCEIILVEGPLSNQPTKQETPGHSLSPRGSRSLMSQLSRDTDIGSRRRLSFCFVEDEWADKEALEEGRDPLQMSLLTIDLSSPLGQRIKKYAKADGALNIIKDPEFYCKTELEDSRLRFRAMDYKVTYRKKCRGCRYVHMYKFNRSNVQEFKARLKTGLSARSRRLKRSMKSLKVSLKRLTEEEIKSWTEEKKVSITENIIYDDDICLTQIEIPESKVKGYLKPNVKKSPSHVAQPQKSQSLQPQPQLHHEHKHFQPSQSSSAPRNNFNHLTSHSQKSGSGLTPSLYLNHSSSPPHVPNIFRNRNFHSASSVGPVPGKVRHAHPPPGPVPGKMRHAHHNTQYRTVPFSGRPNHHKPVLNRQPPPVAGPQVPNNDRLSPASAFSSGLIITERRPLTASANSNSSGRRKQVMTQVRQDEQEDKTPQRESTSTHPKGGIFVNLSSFSSSSNKNRLQCSHAMASSSSLSSNPFSGKNNTHDAREEVPKMSNFEYLSIRKGLLSRGHSLPENNLKRKNSSFSNPSHVSTSASPHSHSSSAFPSTQKQPCVSKSSPHERDHKNANPPQRPVQPQSQRDLGGQKTHSQVRQPKTTPAIAADDDIMEVICIDD